jgi:sec-independent protein translocase protein TatB
MFEVGFTELLVIFVLALVVLGPEKLPRLAAQVGRWIGRARSMAKQFRDQLEEEVNIADINKWQQDTKTESSKPAGTPEPEPTPAADSSPVDSSSEASATSEAPVGDPGPDTTASSGHHDSGPPPEPEAPVNQPPAYATASGANGSGTASPGSTGPSATPSPDVDSRPDSNPQQTTSHDTAAPSDHERPARPGDVITTTHERGI